MTRDDLEARRAYAAENLVPLTAIQKSYHMGAGHPPEDILAKLEARHHRPLLVIEMEAIADYERHSQAHKLRLEQTRSNDSGKKADTLPDDSLRTMAGDIVLKNELSEEDRPSSEWARICGIDADTFRNRRYRNKAGKTWRIVKSGSQRYRVHLEDLPLPLRGSKRLRDDHLNPPKK